MHQEREDVGMEMISNNIDEDFTKNSLHAREESSIEFASKYSSLLTSQNGDFLVSQDGTQVTISELDEKVIGIYFSANWYPPCRNFTNVLKAVYEQLKDCNPGFEVVFVSSDEDLNAFNDYLSTMPWLAVPFPDLGTRKLLTQTFDVEDIPCLVILQPSEPTDDFKYSEVIRDGVGLIHRYGVQAYPFSRKRLTVLEEEDKRKLENQTLMNLLTTHERDFLLGHPMPRQVPVTSIIGKTVGLFFSAQWCLPGVQFTQKLISIYQNIKQMLNNQSKEDFEIVFVSIDHDQMSFNTYFSTMPWLALPFRPLQIKSLTNHFDVHLIPSLVILCPDGKTVAKNGRTLINLYQENAYPFTEERVKMLEKQMDEESKNLPKSEYHLGHRHELTLVSQGNGGGPFICCDCDEQGAGWAYQCVECGYEVHPKCVQPGTEEMLKDTSK